MAPREGNKNAVTHGIRGFLTIGSLPKGAAYIRRQLSQFQNALTEVVADANNGDVSIHAAALIQSACRHEGRAQLLTRYLRHEPDLALADRISILRDLGSATDSRDKCLRQLKLDRDATDAWEDFHKTLIVAETVESAPEATESPNGNDKFNRTSDTPNSPEKSAQTP